MAKNNKQVITWVNFLHIYQPPYQSHDIVKKVSKESYWELVKAFRQFPNARLSLSVSGCLLEHLYDSGQKKLIDAIKALAAKGQIELVGSARYHPILPLLPEKEIIRQITLNDQIQKDAFGEHYHPTGMYLPEMAYSLKVAKMVKKLGFKWIILDEISYKGKFDLVDFHEHYEIKGVGLDVVFRDRSVSKTFVPQTLLKKTTKSTPPTYIVTATDGEMYGHHHQDWQQQLNRALKHRLIQSVSVSDYIAVLPKKAELISPVASSWESYPDELRKGVPYALWDSPSNKIHRLLWDLRKIAIRSFETTKEKGYHFDVARNQLDMGLSSCAWWWASAQRLDLFDFQVWNPDVIEHGIKEMISSIRSLESISKQTKLKAERIYHNLIKEIWKKHWHKYHKAKPKKSRPSVEAKRGMSLLNQNFLVPYFKKNLGSTILKNKTIDFIAITRFKHKIKNRYYHIVARYTIHLKNKKSRPIDVYSNANSQQPRRGAFEALEFIWNSDFGTGAFCSPQPLFYDPLRQAMFYIGPQGDNLYQHVVSPDNTLEGLEKICAMTGRWSARLHRLETSKATNFNPIMSKMATVPPGPKFFTKKIEDRLGKSSIYRGQALQLFKRITSLEKKLAPEKPTVIHGDFHPENIIYDMNQPNRVCVIDFTDCCLADPMRDVGNFLQQLAYMSRGMRTAGEIKKFQQRFLNSYQQQRSKKFSASERQRISLYQGWTAFRSAIFFLTINPFDKKRANDLFQETRRHLVGLK